MDNRQVPSISTDKFISESLLKLDVLYAYFLASEFSQSNIYRSSISSMKYIFNKHSNNETDLVSETKRVLEEYLGRYFKTVETNIEIDDDDGALNIAIKVTDEDDIETSLSNVLSIANGKVDTYKAISDLLIN